MLYAAARSALFRLDAETAHELTLASFQHLPRLATLPFQQTPVDDPVDCLGLRFRNRVGLAAGLDKNGACLEAWARLGFGFVEVGTVTPRPQPGNPRPRMFRLPEHGALINRLGFNNDGVDALVRNVQRARYDGVLGINIGKNAVTAIDDAADDYCLCLEKVYPHADYVTVNISSPNTANPAVAANRRAAGSVVGPGNRCARPAGRSPRSPCAAADQDCARHGCRVHQARRRDRAG